MNTGFLEQNHKDTKVVSEIKEINRNQVKTPNLLKISDGDLYSSWSLVLDYLSKKLRKPSFETWIKPSKLIDIDNGFAVLAVKNEFTRNFISQSFVDLIKEAFKEVFKTALGLRIVIDENLKPEIYLDQEPEQSSFADLDIKTKRVSELNSGLLHNESLSNLFLGSHNQMSYTFAKAILDIKSKIYKSLFVFSHSGLGKTYFLNAIGNEAKLSTENLVYIKAEDFTNQFISCIRSSKSESFRNKFRNLDLLLFDDFEFMDNKKSSQEELAHTIASINSRGGRVVIASSKSIEEFKFLHSALLSLLGSALHAEIHNPDLQSKFLIIEKLSNDRNLNISEEHKEFIARKYSNISQIENALNQLKALQEYSDLDIDNDMISKLFGSVHPAETNQGLSLEIITELVSEYFHVSINDIKSKRRIQSLVRARHIAIYLAYELLDLSYSSIGEYFGSRKHSSVIHSIKTIREEIALNNAIQIPESRSAKNIIEEIKRRINLKLGKI